EVGVALALADRDHLAAFRLRVVPVVGVGPLVHVLGLDADVAAHRHRTNLGADVGAHEGGGDLLVHAPLLRDQPALGGGRVEHHVAGHRRRDVPGGNHARAGEAQVDRGVLQVGGAAGVALRAGLGAALALGRVPAAAGVGDACVRVR